MFLQNYTWKIKMASRGIHVILKGVQCTDEFTCKLSSKSPKIDMFDWNPLFCSFRDSGFWFTIVVVILYVFYSMSHILFWWQILIAACHPPHPFSSWHPRCGKMWSLVNWLQLFRRILQMDPQSMVRFCRSWRKTFFQEPSVPLACEFILFFFGWQCHSYFVVWKMVVVTVSSLFSGQYEKFRSWLKVSRCLPLVQLL